MCYKSKVEKIAQAILTNIPENPQTAVILGSGLDWIADNLKNKIVIEYSALPDMPKTNVSGHKNKFIFGYINNKPIIVMQGRFHLYAGFTAKEVVLPVYIFKLLGCKNLIVTNSAGAVNESFNVGDIMLITDHINLTGTNPLIKEPIIDYGEFFVDLSNAYDEIYNQKIIDLALEQNLDLKQGVYLQLVGPSYETKAEVNMAKILKADAVGMSTALETIAGNQCKMKVVGFSLISNMATGISKNKLNHKEVLSVAKEAGQKLAQLLYEFISLI